MLKVLIVDDNRLLADSLAALPLWEQCGCAVQEVCYDSLAGKEAILRLKPDIVLLDIQMPGLNGLDTVEMLQPQLENSVVIFMSAYDNFRYAQRALRLGAHDYLLKPFSRDALQGCVKKAAEYLSRIREKPQEPAAQISEPDDADVIDPIIRYVNQRIDQHVTAEEVAEAFFMSTSKLDRLIRNHCGKGFREARIELRMKAACELLRDIRYSVEDIASKVGYSNYATFYRAFIREYGMSPTEYRENKKTE